jgi:hypothetical protein
VGPVLVPNQTVQGRVPTPRPLPRPMPAPLEEGGDALIELTSFGRGNADEIVKEPPEGSATSVSPITQMRRSAGDAGATPALPDS